MDASILNESGCLNESVVFLCEKRPLPSPAFPPKKRLDLVTPKRTLKVDASTMITPNRFTEPIPINLLPGASSAETYQQLLEKTQLKVAKINDKLRPIVIDGSNVAMAHGHSTYNDKSNKVFSCRGILQAVKYFLDRGHQNVMVIVPHNRKRYVQHDGLIVIDRGIMDELEKNNNLIFTPAREINGRTVICYDDRFIIELAAETGGVIVSNDQYRDLLKEGNQKWKEAIQTRLLQYVFAHDLFMVPDDPLGRTGPSLQKLLSFPPPIKTNVSRPMHSRVNSTGNKNGKAIMSTKFVEKAPTDSKDDKPVKSTNRVEKEKQDDSKGTSIKAVKSTNCVETASKRKDSKIAATFHNNDTATSTRFVEKVSNKKDYKVASTNNENYKSTTKTINNERAQPAIEKSFETSSQYRRRPLTDCNRAYTQNPASIRENYEYSSMMHYRSQSSWSRSAKQSYNLESALLRLYPNMGLHIRRLLHQYKDMNNFKFFECKLNNMRNGSRFLAR